MEVISHAIVEMVIFVDSLISAIHLCYPSSSIVWTNPYVPRSKHGLLFNIGRWLSIHLKRRFLILGDGFQYWDLEIHITHCQDSQYWMTINRPIYHLIDFTYPIASSIITIIVNRTTSNLIIDIIASSLLHLT